MLYRDVVEKLQKRYENLFKRAIPKLKIAPGSIEVVDHGLSNGEADENFLDCGLGISIREIYRRGIGNTQVGYTGKLLAWLPYQFMPEHRHRDIVAVPKRESISEELMRLENAGMRLVRLEELVKNFSTVVGFNPYDYQFLTMANDRVNLDSRIMPKDSIIIPGKAETFDIIYGNGSFFLPGEATSKPRFPIPNSQKPYVHHLHEEYVNAGSQLAIPPNTPHSARAGHQGMVAIEYSMPSRDEADIFTHLGIKRHTEIKER